MLHRRRPRASALAFVVAIVALAALFVPAALFAQTPSLTVQLTGMTGDAWPQGQAFVTVLGADGRPLPGLTANDVHTSIDGTDVPVGAVTQGINSDQPIDVVLTLDASGSMQGTAIEQAKAAALTFLEQLDSRDRVSIVTFGTTVSTALPFTEDRAAARAAIEGLTADGTTALFEATAESVRVASTGVNSRRAIVLLSDGGIGILGGIVTREGAIAAAQTGGVPIFSIGLGTEVDRGYLTELADVTGGRFAETPSPEGLAALYQQVGELLRGQYIVTLDASAPDVERSQPINLHVDVTQNGLTGSDERAVCAQSVCVAISGIAEGAQIDGQQTVLAQVVAAEAVTSVALAIDGETIVTLVAPPYTFTIDGAALQDGDHNVVVEAKTASASATTAELSVHAGAVSSSGRGAGGLLPIVAMAGAGVLAVLVIWIVFRRRGRHPQPAAPIGPEPEPPTSSPEPFDSGPRPRSGRLWPDEPDVAVQPATAHQALGTLLMTEGEMTGRSWPLGSAPISIGTGHRCLIRVAQIGVDDIANEHARVWVREDHLVLHELRRLTAFGPTGGRWEFLNAGDTFAVGPHVFQFQLADQAVPEKPQEAAAAAETRPGPGTPQAERETATVGQSSQQAPATPEPSIAKTGEPPAATGSLPPTPQPSPFAAPPAQSEREVSETSDVPNILREHKPDEASPPAPSEGEPDSGVPNILRERPAEAPAEKKGEDAA